MSYIISNRNELIAETEKNYPSGMTVRFAYMLCEERLNANREYNLVNARNGKISNAGKWADAMRRMPWDSLRYATEINPGEFQIVGGDGRYLFLF